NADNTVIPLVSSHQNAFPAIISRCSRMGPRLSAGKKVRAPMMSITPMRRTVNKGVVTGNVPREGGTYFFCARLPAIASIGMIMKKRPISIVKAPAMLYQGVLVVKPANAEPLLPACEVKEYRIWLRPCGPGFEMLDVPKLATDEIAENPRMTSGNTSTTSMAIFTS